jgi:hypothetical protein
MHDNELKQALVTLIDQQKELITTLKDKPDKKKDFWDKFSSISTFLSGVIVALVGLYFTTGYNAQQSRRDEILKAEQLKISQVELMQKFIPQLNGTEKEKKLALIALSALGNPELATKLATLDQSEGSRAALESLVQSGDPDEKSLAERALRNYRNYESYFTNIQGGSQIGRAALNIAIGELKSGVWEHAGVGSGPPAPRIGRYFLPSGLVPERGTPWSAAFVSWCFAVVRDPWPFKPSASWRAIRSEFKDRGWLHEESGYLPQPGDVMFIRFKTESGDGYKVGGHGGIVFHYQNGQVDTIEGNASDEPRLPGRMVVARTRPAQGDTSTEIAFGHVPD